jgi:hypothetical protein
MGCNSLKVMTQLIVEMRLDVVIIGSLLRLRRRDTPEWQVRRPAAGNQQSVQPAELMLGRERCSPSNCLQLEISETRRKKPLTVRHHASTSMSDSRNTPPVTDSMGTRSR